MSSPLPQGSPGRVRVQRIAEAAVERARLRVVPRAPRVTRAPRVPFATLVSLVLLAGVVGLLMFNTTMQQNAFAATSLEQRAASLTSREQTLRMDLEVLRDPQRVAERAQRLGMVPAATPAFLRITDGKVLGVPTVSTAQERFDILPTAPAKPAVLNPRKTYVEVPAPSVRERRRGEPRNQRAAAARDRAQDRAQDRAAERTDRSDR